MRLLDFSDGFTSATEPSVGSVSSSGFQSYASDAAFVTAKGSAAANGDAYYNSTSNQVKAYINSAWREVVANDRSQVLTNKDFDGGTAASTSRITVPQANKSALDALTRKAGTIVYATDQTKLYVDNGSSLIGIGGGGGGGSLSWAEGNPSPTAVFLASGLMVYEFVDAESQSMTAAFLVPSSYTAGAQINLRTQIYSADTSGNILFQTVTTLIRAATDVITSTTNQRTSTNSAITLSAGTANEPQSVVCDLTSSTGQVNAVSVAAGDLLIIKFTRGTGTATGSGFWITYGSEVTTS